MGAIPHQKFGFDTEFFEVVGGARGGPTASSQTPLPRGPEAQRQQAYAEGHAAGLAEGQAQAQADLARMQQHLQNTLLSLQQTLEEREHQLISHTLGLMQRSLVHLVGHAAQHYPTEVLEHHLRQLLPLARTDEALTLRIHPQARGYHEKLGLPQATIMGLPLRVVPESSLGPVDALIEWQHGGVEARLAEHTEMLSTLLQAAGATPLPPAPLNLTTPAEPVAPEPPAPTPTPAPEAQAPLTAQAGPATEMDAALAAAAEARAQRAAALLGDDELVDALK